jgi:hypothetical protein
MSGRNQNLACSGFHGRLLTLIIDYRILQSSQQKSEIGNLGNCKLSFYADTVGH